MKTGKFKKFLSLILLAPTLILLGCMPTISSGNGGDYGAITPDKTHTINGDPFLGAYVVVDPGSGAEFDDSFSNTKKTFAELLQRQYEALAGDISYRLWCVYGEYGEIQDLEFAFETGYKIEIKTNNVIDNNITSLTNINDMSKFDSWTHLNITQEDSFLKEAFKTYNSINGGYIYTNSGFNNNLDSEYKWISNINSDIDSEQDLRAIILYRILNVVSGIASDNPSDHYEVIDHLGFTESEKQGIRDTILNNIIGESNLIYDAECLTSLKTCLGDSLIVSESFNTHVEDNGTTANIDENAVWKNAHRYKGYEPIVNKIIDSALEDGVFSADKNAYSTLPRASVMFMDIYTLQGTNKQEVEDAENGNIDYEYEEGDQIRPLEKYLDDLRLLSIILIPNEVTSNPNAFVSGELVPDTSIVLDGFILGSIDFAIAGESGFNSTIYAEVEINAKGHNITQDNGDNFKTDPIQIYGDKIPENDDEPNYNVYLDLLPKEYTSSDGSISKDEMLIGGYNGNKVDDEKYGFSYTSHKTQAGGDYKLYTLKTCTDFMGYDDNGISFNGGSNFVKVNFIFSEIFVSTDTNKTNNIVNSQVNTLLNLLGFNPEVC